MDETLPGFFPQHEVHVGRDLGGRTTTIGAADVARYETGLGGPSPQVALGDGTAAAPALLFHSEVYRSLAWYLPNIFGNLHARQEWEMFAPLVVGSAVRTRSTVVERYAKRNREYVVNEVLITDADGRWLQRSRTHQSFLAEEGRGEIVVDRVGRGGSTRAGRVARDVGLAHDGLAPAQVLADVHLVIAHLHALYHARHDQPRAIGRPCPGPVPTSPC